MVKKRKHSELLMRIIISAVGVALILIAISNLALFFFGEKVIANVTTRRVGGADDQYQPNQQYEWSVDYSFKDKNGVIHNGHTTMRGGALPPKTDNKIYYFTFAPFMNALEREAQPNISQPIFVVIGIFLLLVMNRKTKKQRLRPNKEIKDYDDSVEELISLTE